MSSLGYKALGIVLGFLIIVYEVVTKIQGDRILLLQWIVSPVFKEVFLKLVSNLWSFAFSCEHELGLEYQKPLTSNRVEMSKLDGTLLLK